MSSQFKQDLQSASEAFVKANDVQDQQIKNSQNSISMLNQTNIALNKDINQINNNIEIFSNN